MCGVERDLLNLGEVVLHVLVQEKLANLAERELALRPDVCHIEHVDLLLLPDLLSLLRGHGLEHDIPAREVTLLDRLVKVLGRVVRAVVEGIFLCDESSALLALEMQLRTKSVGVSHALRTVRTYLAVYPVTVLVLKLVCVAVISMHLAVTVGNTSVTKEYHELMSGLWVLRGKVPEGCCIIRVGKVGCGIAFLSMLSLVLASVLCLTITEEFTMK